MAKIRAALIQPEWYKEPEQALEETEHILEELCQKEQPDFISLPEFFTGAPLYMPDRYKYKERITYTVPGVITQRLSKIAKKYSVFILCGTFVEEEDGRYYNTSVLLNSDGSIAGKARKIHRYASELSNIEPGTGQLVVNTPLGKIGVCVCSDFWIPEMPRMLALKGAEIICVPGNSLVQNLGIVKPVVLANSVNNCCYTLYNSVSGMLEGIRNGRVIKIEFGGYSTISGPVNIINSLGRETGVCIGELDLDYLRELRKLDVTFSNTSFWTLLGRRPGLYKDILKPYEGADGSFEEQVRNYLGKGR